ncbi:Zona pellucida sperm-binding protein 4 [Oryzias melastigma]|uniref:Zona pellucida sperm-binding protein 4 n=1 Tax=Oryzias melastigma TaxID=30732 RepID=A0A834FJ30_ORYME|nr:Zona pellucida sperm-binding protein 4 [Oryzias melastigma]
MAMGLIHFCLLAVALHGHLAHGQGFDKVGQQPQYPSYPQKPQSPQQPQIPQNPQQPQIPQNPQQPQYPSYPQKPQSPQQPQIPQNPQQPQIPQNPQQPQYPSYPQKPQSPQQPQIPQNPQQPQIPQNPQQPQIPQNPQQPQIPQNPQQPQYPSYPQKPQSPQKPQQPQYPSYPQKPQSPQKPQQPQYPQNPQQPQIPQNPQQPQIPQNPQQPQYPSYPQKPQSPQKPQQPQYPSYPQKPQSPQKPQYPQNPQQPQQPQYPQNPQQPQYPQNPQQPQYPQNPPKTPSKPQDPQVPTSTFHTCEVDEHYKIPCGSSNITSTECDAINCCFDGYSCYYGKYVTLQCTKDGQFIIVIAKDATLPHIDLETVSFLGAGAECHPAGATSAFAIYQFPVTSCGTIMRDEPGVIVYENRMSSFYEVAIGPRGAITRDSHFDLSVQCRYIGTSVEALVIEVDLVPPPSPVAAPGLLRVELRLGKDVAYTSYYNDADYPVTKVLRDNVYVEVRMLERTDPNLVLTLGRCWATTSSFSNSVPQWDLLIDGCPNHDDRYLTTLVPVGCLIWTRVPNSLQAFYFQDVHFCWIWTCWSI